MFYIEMNPTILNHYSHVRQVTSVLQSVPIVAPLHLYTRCGASVAMLHLSSMHQGKGILQGIKQSHLKDPNTSIPVYFLQVLSKIVSQ